MRDRQFGLRHGDGHLRSRHFALVHLSLHLANGPIVARRFEPVRSSVQIGLRHVVVTRQRRDAVEFALRHRQRRGRRVEFGGLGVPRLRRHQNRRRQDGNPLLLQIDLELEGAWIDRSNQVAGAHPLIVVDRHGLNDPGDLGSHRDEVGLNVSILGVGDEPAGSEIDHRSREKKRSGDPSASAPPGPDRGRCAGRRRSGLLGARPRPSCRAKKPRCYESRPRAGHSSTDIRRMTAAPSRICVIPASLASSRRRRRAPVTFDERAHAKPKAVRAAVLRNMDIDAGGQPRQHSSRRLRPLGWSVVVRVSFSSPLW